MSYHEEQSTLIQEAGALAMHLVRHTALCYIDINTSMGYVHVDQPMKVSKGAAFFSIMDEIATLTGWNYELLGGRAREVSRYDEPVLVWSKAS